MYIWDIGHHKPGLQSFGFSNSTTGTRNTLLAQEEKGSNISSENATKETWQKPKVIGCKDYNSSFIKKKN